MKLAFRLAYKNIMGAGLRTWLNVGILSFVFVLIIFYRAFLIGWQEQGIQNSVAWEYGYGQLQNSDYDPADPFTLDDGHGILPDDQQQNLVPLLLRQASIYPQGRMMPIVLKGIGVDQELLKLPTQKLRESAAAIPAIVGTRMAEAANLKEGDQVLLRWRDKEGTFDAANVTIAGIFSTQVPGVDVGQIWIPLRKLQQMTGLQGHATLFVANSNFVSKNNDGWRFVSQQELLKELNAAVEAESISGWVIYLLLLSIALLAIFDTQVLSIFRRQREIGTYISLGLTRNRVVNLFTIEGTMYSLLATFVGGIYGLPIFLYFGTQGIGMGGIEEMGFGMSSRIYPAFGFSLILTTFVLVVVSSALISYWPARKIARLDPVKALKSKH
ncbi:MAG: ABC transporter permease [Clostridia bacterium]|nr:ABC transporter permease [Clostridia bacterium]